VGGAAFHDVSDGAGGPRLAGDRGDIAVSRDLARRDTPNGREHAVAKRHGDRKRVPGSTGSAFSVLVREVLVRVPGAWNRSWFAFQLHGTFEPATLEH
jgi:hypothetical protein